MDGDRTEADRTAGLAAWHRRDVHRAARAFGAVVAELEDAGAAGTPRHVNALSDHALALERIGDGGGALKARRAALRHGERFAAAQPVAVRLLRRRLAQSHQALGDLAEAERLYAAAEPDPDDPVGERISWSTSMALLAEETGRIRQAILHYGDVASACDEVADDDEAASGLVQALGNATQLFVETGRFDDAARHLRRMRRAARGDGRLATRLAVLDVRMAALAARDRHRAAARLAAASEALMREVAPGHSGLSERAACHAGLLMRDGCAERARAHLEAVRHPVGQLAPSAVGLLLRLSELHGAAGMTEEAHEALAQALAADAGTPRPLRRWEVLAALSDRAHDEGRHPAAVLLGKLAIERVGPTARALLDGGLDDWLGARLAAYDALLDRLMLAGRPLEACALQLRRAREAGTAIGPRRAADDGEAVPYRPQEADLRDRLRRIDEQAHAARIAAGTDEVPPGIVEAVRLWLEAVWALGPEQTAATTWARALASAPLLAGDDVPVLTILRRGPRLSAVLRDGGGEAMGFDVALSTAEVAALARRLRTACAQGADEAHVIEPARALHDALIGPARARLAGCSRLDLAVDGFLSLIPFAALHDGDGFLVERFALARRTGQPRRAGGVRGDRRMVVLGGARVGSARDAFAEAERVAALADAARVPGPDLTPARMAAELARGARIVHLACHYHHDLDRPGASSLQMGDGADLILEDLSGEAFDLSGVGLLVLACCTTGVSDAADGVGVEGLAGLAQAKGVGDVVASLWEVDDLATSALMRAFYDRLLGADGAGSDPVLALAGAQRAMAAQGRGAEGRRGGLGARRSWNPGDWSGFCAYVGEDAPPQPEVHPASREREDGP